MRPVRVVQALLLVVLLLVAGASTAQADAPPCADLQITGMSTSPTEPVQGLDATVSVTVKNAGTCAAGGFVVQWKSDRFAPTGPSESVTSLDAGASTTVNFTYAFPSSGNFTTFASVDTGNAVSETNENNNLEISPVTVQPQKIDLKVTKIELDPTPAVAGHVATVNVTISNTGNAPAGPFRLDWSPALFNPSLSRQISGLGTNETTTVSFTYTYANAGTFNSNASIDTTGMVGETDEFNNTTWQDVVVDPDLPNLRIADFSLDQPECGECECNSCQFDHAGLKTKVLFTEGPVIQGTPAHFTVRIINDGHQPSGSFRVQWTPHFLASPLTEQVDSLGVGETVDVHFTYTFPWAGKMDGTVVVDTNNAVNEVHENDNTADTSVNVEAATRDLEVTGLSVSPGSPVQGAEATFYATVTNHGNSPTGPFVLELNPDTFEVITPSMKTVAQQVSDLGPGESTTLALPVTYPQKGNFRVVAKADAFDKVAETNEANNLKILNVTVKPAPIDLVITDFSISPTQPVRGEPATASITVKNNGPIATPDFFVSWKQTDDAWFPSLAYVQGLHPGESKTVTMQGTYWGTGTFTTVAQVDVFNQVEEPAPGAEDNNTQSKSVTVVPPSTTLDVKLDHLLALNDMDDGPLGTNQEGEWNPILFAVFDPSANCDVNISRGPLSFHQNVPMVRCTTTSDNSVQDDDADKKIVGVNRTLRVTLEDFTPLVAAVGVLEDDDPLAPDVPGFSTLIKFKPDYLNLPGTIQTPGQGCSKISALGEVSEASGGHCFDAFWQVSTVGTVGSSSLARTMTEEAIPGVTSRVSNSTIRLAAKNQSYLNRSLRKLQRNVAKFNHKVRKSHKKGARKAKLRVRVRTVHR